MLKVETKKNVILKWVKKRIDNNKNLIIVINGQTGSGKTYGGLRFCVDISEIFGTNFSIETNVDFNFVNLLKKMQLPENKKPGTCFLFEEVGAIGGGASNQQWQSKANQFFSSFMQTSRHKRQIFVMTCPNFKNLQKSTRELCHMQWAMMSINPKTKLAAIKPLEIQINETSGKMYMKKLRFNHNGSRFSLGKLELGLPPDNIIENYEKEKNNFTDALNQKIIDSAKPKLKPLTEKQNIFMGLYQKGLDMKSIAKEMGVVESSVYHHKDLILNKGYSLEKGDNHTISIQKPILNLNSQGVVDE